MKRIFTVIICITLMAGLLSGCNRGSTESNADEIVICKNNGMINEDGRLYYDYINKRLSCFDFSLNESIAVCSRPNCTHNTVDCSAYFEVCPGGIAFYNGHLYYFINGALYEADKDGTNRRKITDTSFSNLAQSAAVYTDNKVFFDISMIPEDASVGSNDRITGIACIDLKSGNTDVLIDMRGENEYIVFDGYYDGYVYGETVDQTDLENVEFEIFRVNCETKQREAFMSEYNESSISIGGHYAFIYSGWKDSDAENVVIAVDLDNGLECKELSNSKSYYPLDYIDGKYFFTDIESESYTKDFLYYDFETEQLVRVPSDLDPKAMMGINYETEDFFIGSIGFPEKLEDGSFFVTESGKMIKLSKEDFYAGNHSNYEVINDIFY